MADSDNNTTLPSVTRGRADLADADVSNHADAADPALALRRDWLHAHYVSQVLCRLQQRLEARMMVNTGIPVLTGTAAFSSSFGPTMENSAQTELAADYAIAREAEVFAMTGALKLQDAIPETTALSLAGVVAKLEIILGADRDIGDPTDFPWPHIASVLRDLRAIAGDLPAYRPDRAATREDADRHFKAAAKLVAALDGEDAAERREQAIQVEAVR